MSSGLETFAIWTTGLILSILIVPLLAWTIYSSLRRRKRQRMVDTPRRISLVEKQDNTNSACKDHVRSKSKAHRNADGDIISECVRCGVPMARTGPKDWRVSDAG